MIPILTRAAPAADVLSEPPQFERELEGLRGFAALAVLLGHVFGVPGLVVRSEHWPPRSLNFFNVGISAVLVFFVLSGYVIGLRNRKPFSASVAATYAKRRLLRIVPIYLLALGLGVGVLWHSVTAEQIVGHFLFVQDLFTPRIEGNTPLWSISHEMFFYGLFLLVLVARPPWGLLWCALPLIGLAGLLGYAPRWLHLLACGFAAWTIGLAVAWALPRETKPERIPLPAWLLLFYATHNLGPMTALLARIGLPVENYRNDPSLAPVLNALPLTLLCFATFTGRGMRWHRALHVAAWALPLAFATYLLLTKRFAEPRWVPGLVLLGLAVLALPIRIPTGAMGALERLGRISYGLYVVHFPLLIALREWLPIAHDTTGFAIRAVLGIALSLSAAWLLEAKFHPWLVEKLSKAKAPPDRVR